MGSFILDFTLSPSHTPSRCRACATLLCLTRTGLSIINIHNIPKVVWAICVAHSSHSLKFNLQKDKTPRQNTTGSIHNSSFNPVHQQPNHTSNRDDLRFSLAMCEASDKSLVCLQKTLKYTNEQGCMMHDASTNARTKHSLDCLQTYFTILTWNIPYYDMKAQTGQDLLPLGLPPSTCPSAWEHGWGAGHNFICSLQVIVQTGACFWTKLSQNICVFERSEKLKKQSMKH